MIPLRVSLEGFLSYQEKQVIDFEGSSLWMLWGSNGVGKSAVFDAITFALFGAHRAGKDARNAKELINHHADKFSIEFDFSVDGVAYRIRRTCPRNGRPTRLAFELQSNEAARVNGIPIAGTDDDDGLKKWVADIIGLDYKTFTSSVLLLQGKSERLLNADPKGRYDILAEIIDLSRYQQLYVAADDRRKFYSDRTKSLELQLQGEAMRAVSDEEVDAAKSNLRLVNEEWQGLQASIEWLTGWRAQAEQWEKDMTQLKDRRAELQPLLALLTREAEITENFAELQALYQVLDPLSQIVTQRQSVLEKEECIGKLRGDCQRLEESLREAEERQTGVVQQVTQLEQTLTELRQTKERSMNRLLELSPLVERLERIEEQRVNIEKLDTELAVFPTDMKQRFEEAEAQARVIVTKSEVLPWLNSFAQARMNFSKALKDEEDARVQANDLRKQLQDLENDHASLNRELAEAGQVERSLLGEKTSAHTRHNTAVKQFASFEDAATKPVCELCGQEITADHAQREKARLQLQREEIKQGCDVLDEAYRQADERLQSTKRAISALDSQMRSLTDKCSRRESDQRQAQNQARIQVQQLRAAYDNIQSSYQQLVITFAPSGDADWLTTVYPTETDLNVLRKEIAEKQKHESYLEKLRRELVRWQQLATQKALICQQLENLTASTNVEAAKTARDEKNALEQKRVLLEAEILQQTQAFERKKGLAQKASAECERLKGLFQQSHASLDSEQAVLKEMNRVLLSNISGLPEDWQAQAASLDTVGLQLLDQKCETLSEYEQLHDDLRDARQSKVTCEQRIDELNRQLASYAPEACRPAVEVGQDLEAKRALWRQVDDKRNDVIQQLAKMEKQREQRKDLEQQKRLADRLARLYKVLADLLGRSGLQLYLLRRAEKMIVELANKTLNGLSHGRMHLELRRESDATVSQTEKALDLVVHDRDTGQHAILLDLASGSQHFRIAVSLALAIGRYTSREARPVESVIIDEGFGSLDKAGRDDMIQELNVLREQLARIILVSHQDEFANAFPDRYSFKLEKGASHVSLMEAD